MSVPKIIGATVGVVMACVAFGNVVPSDTPSVATMAACQEEDGSTPGQEFPCHWDAATQGNGQGGSYTLIYHLCTQAEDRAAAIAWLSGHATPRQCQSE